MYIIFSNLGCMVFSKIVTVGWVAVFSSFIYSANGQGLYTLDLNEKAGEGIYVAEFQVNQVEKLSSKSVK